MGKDIAHEVDLAALPSRAQHFGDRGFDAFMAVGDDQLHAAQAAARELAQEGGPNEARRAAAWMDGVHDPDGTLPPAHSPHHTPMGAGTAMTRVTLGKSRMQESRLSGSVRAKAEWPSYSTTTRT
jgi:hypothetical protein